MASHVTTVVKNSAANAGDTRDAGSIPGWGRSPGGGNGSPFQDSCLTHPMDRVAWRAPVHVVTKRWTRLSTHTHTGGGEALSEPCLFLEGPTRVK